MAWKHAALTSIAFADLIPALSVKKRACLATKAHTGQRDQSGDHYPRCLQYLQQHHARR
ncbi:hypothetical protein [Desulfobulbus alkaliphilus]|uniref:hypothetical protein n=1 Tax=Desulfobulbus alkaliphilus TaxID=869814 RepID=UPI001962486C|nr:hypothetical protein [Desulfobulbus alkaliphilus]MBM9537791.1 hypothetical protein [Desulfobulbus alkaliphilus]